MFNALKQQLSAFETKVQAKLSELRGVLRGLRTDIAGLDAAVVGPLERMAGTVGTARSALSQKLTAVRAELSALEPPR